MNDSFPPVIDGVVNVMMNYAKYLMKDYNSQIIVGTPSYPGADYTAYPYPVVAYQSFDTAAVTNGYRTGNPFEEKAISELTAFKPDIIHSHCPASATIISRILREETGAPIIFTYHTKYDIDIERAVKIKAIAQEGIKAMVGNIEACDDIWVVSRGAGESLRALGFQGDYTVMNNGVDFERGRVSQEKVQEATAGYDLPDGVPVLLFVGRMMSYKGIPMILDALKILKDSGQDFRMVLIGKGPDRESLEAKARKLGLMEEGNAKCIFTGPIYDRDVLRAWNTRADLFLFPSTFDTNGLVVREAAACGLASVLIRDSCAAEGVTDGRNGFIIDENAESMAALLEKVCGNLDYLHDVGTHAMDEIYLSWESCVKTAYERYGVILDQKKSGKLPVRKREATDVLVSLTARSMSERRRRRQMYQTFFDDFRDSAVGMMENMQEAEERFYEKVEAFRQESMESLQEAQDKMRTKLESMKQEHTEIVQEKQKQVLEKLETRKQQRDKKLKA